MEGTFFYQALVYLAVAVLFVPIAKKLGLGSVLGYLLAGILIGPFVLNLVGEEGSDIMHFAEFGVVMMLFLVGLELEPELLWRLRAPIVGMGGLQVTLTAFICTGIGVAVGLPWKQALAIGLILAMSSTAIVLQSMTEKGQMKSAAGQSAFSVLLFQDIAVIPILALMPLLAPATAASTAEHDATWVANLPAWAHTLAVLGSVALVIVAGRYLISPLLRMIAATQLREMFTATALLLVVSITVLMIQVGLSPALGTFLAGVVLANSEYKHELESDIEPFKGLLLGLFFIAVGASIDFGLIVSEPTLIIQLVVVVMVVKGLVLFGLGKAFKLATAQNLLFGVALSQVGEFAFVLFSFTGQQGILDERTISLLMAVVAITMGLTPLVMLVNEKYIMPRVCSWRAEDEKQPDTIDEKNPVIIAGFDRFGNITGRFLKAFGVGTTVLDNDSDRVDLLRKVGLKVYYGDASRHELLHAAGAAEAKMIIIALDSPEKCLELVETVKKHFPHLHILVRANDRTDAYDLMDAGVPHIYRETLDTSLRMGTDALKLLGFRAYSVQRAAQLFLRHDEQALKGLAAVRDDRKQYINVARERIEELEQTILSDLNGKMLEYETGWDAESLREEVRSSAFPPAIVLDGDDEKAEVDSNSNHEKAK
ncbi:monovalent cation:proton antiporter-2 (CPA2) family protein [Rhodocytophaga aerolata]|uniref:Monovalent cation:proton antiporter-2 (CPA2) family protein n=1 Tax=Rhodocytophaga aerolata TaxID=455078 RepID=A0ABT8R4W9_9BACT|nr:monovalent cation:proton antiporter-2 (CPA2) family protein [Rhodocytophaga aerolata]MDO1447134.1 monovalent cation:proton antiporter-2 (CPA2) family protein [Rhodocytophaga aerolata]